jgi:phospholipase A-2-activating protein
MPNGDIVSGCSDGIIRVFSVSEERWASIEKLKEYDDHVASQALPAQQVGDVKKSDLPGAEALNTPGMLASLLSRIVTYCSPESKGKKSGEVKMIKNGDLIEAHQVSNIMPSV